MDKSKSILTSLLLLGLFACTTQVSETPTPTGTSGIEGYVTEGPMCPGPVRIGAAECQDQPYQATILVLSASGTQVTQFQTDVMGYFKLPLSPGTYVLHPQAGKPLPRAGDQTIEVTQGSYTKVSIIYDTGMR